MPVSSRGVVGRKATTAPGVASGPKAQTATKVKGGASAVAKGGAPLVVLVGVWYVASVVAISTSKLSMQIAKVPFTLCLFQFLTAAFISRVACGLQSSPPGALKEEFSSVGKVAASYTGGFMLTNVAFSLASAPFVETVKSSEPITTVILALLLLGEKESLRSLLCLLPVIGGVALASMSGSDSVGFAWPAFLVVQACNLGFSGRAVFVKQLKQKFPSAGVATNDLQLFFHVHRLGLCILVPVVAFLEGPKLLELMASSKGSEIMVQLASTMALNGVFYSIYNLFSFFVLSRVPTSVHAVLNVFRRVVVILLTTLFFQVPMGAQNIAGVAMAVGGVLLFKAAKQQQLKKAV